MRILWLSNAPWGASGYAEQTALFVPRLQQLGHEMAILCNHGLQGAVMPWHGIPCFPSDNTAGNVNLHTFTEHHQADLVVTLCDAWTLKPDMWPAGPPVAMWAPVDHDRLPPFVQEPLSHERARPVAMSRFGETSMQDCGLDPVYVPHGIDTSLFRPQPELRAEIRKDLDIPEDVFLVGMVAANKGTPALPRKGFGFAFDAFARFAKHREDAWMYVHSEPKPAVPGSGIFLDQSAEDAGCPPGRVRFLHDRNWHLGMTHMSVSRVYQAADVLLHTSLGEGFGLAALEAQACGVPVITCPHSAMRELCGAGWLVDGQPMQDHVQRANWFIPFTDSIEAALNAAYESRDDQELKDSAVAFAQAYDADLVTVEHWEPALEKLAGPREIPPLQVNGNRAMRRAAKKGKVPA